MDLRGRTTGGCGIKERKQNYVKGLCSTVAKHTVVTIDHNNIFDILKINEREPIGPKHGTKLIESLGY